MATVWFGDWKSWINLHLASCAANPTIQWVFLHDQESLPEFRPANVKFVRTSLQECEGRIRQTLRKDIVLKSPYEMCDFKPILGAAFPEWVPSGQWWGYCDSDLLWGDMRQFLTEDVLANHHVITAHVCTIVGQCTLFRDADIARRIFLEIEGLDHELQMNGYRGLDELKIDRAVTMAEARGVRVLRKMWQPWERLYQLSWEAWASELESKRQGYPVTVSFPTGPCEWKEGQIRHLESGIPFMFFHFLEWKRQMNYPTIKWPIRDLDFVRIVPAGLQFGWKRRALWHRSVWFGRVWWYRRVGVPVCGWRQRLSRNLRKLRGFVPAFNRLLAPKTAR